MAVMQNELFQIPGRRPKLASKAPLENLEHVGYLNWAGRYFGISGTAWMILGEMLPVYQIVGELTMDNRISGRGPMTVALSVKGVDLTVRGRYREGERRTFDDPGEDETFEVTSIRGELCELPAETTVADIVGAVLATLHELRDELEIEWHERRMV